MTNTIEEGRSHNPQEVIMLPDLKTGFQKFVDTARRRLIFPKKDLDTLYTWWVTSSYCDAETDLLAKSVSPDDLPDLEKKRATSILEDRRKRIQSIKGAIRDFVTTEKPSWGNARRIVHAITACNEKHSTDEQVTAVCEAIVETRKQNPDPSVMRQKIAQYAWGELMNAFTYANLQYQANTDVKVTTVDDYKTERDEITHALNGELWNEEELKQQRKAFLQWKEAIDENCFDETGIAYYRLGNCVRGEIPKKVSAIDILFTSESILHDLIEGELFDYTFDEIEEDSE